MSFTSSWSSDAHPECTNMDSEWMVSTQWQSNVSLACAAGQSVSLGYICNGPLPSINRSFTPAFLRRHSSQQHPYDDAPKERVWRTWHTAGVSCRAQTAHPGFLHQLSLQLNTGTTDESVLGPKNTTRLFSSSSQRVFCCCHISQWDTWTSLNVEGQIKLVRQASEDKSVTVCDSVAQWYTVDQQDGLPSWTGLKQYSTA